jgi:ribulose-phosphate 3-epimerase
MDGCFVPNITMGPFIVETCRKITSLPLDVHLMIVNPERHIPSFASAGASRLSVQIETCPHIHRTLGQIRELGVNPGVVINPGTPVDTISQVLNLVDLVLVMSVNPGFSGQAFIPEVLTKAAQIRQKLDAINPDAYVEMDGGITPANLPQITAAGVEAVVAATSIFKNTAGISEGVRQLRAAFPA